MEIAIFKYLQEKPNIMPDDCIFCKIANNEIPSTKVYEDKNSLAFLDLFPAVKGHALVIPKQHYQTILEIPPKELQNLIAVVQKVAAAVEKGLNSTGSVITQLNNKAAGQAIPHIHFHVIPRYKNDGMKFRAEINWWQQTKYNNNQEMGIYAEKIKKNL